MFSTGFKTGFNSGFRSGFGLRGGVTVGAVPSFNSAHTSGNSLERTVADGLTDFSTIHTAGAVGAWVRLDVGGAFEDERVMHSRWVFPSQEQFHAGFTKLLEPRLYYTAGGTNATLTTLTATNPLVNNVWTHVLWTWDATSCDLYINFALDQSFGGVTMYGSPTSDYHIGGSDDGAPLSIQRFANPTAWSAKLTATEVAAMASIEVSGGTNCIFALTKNLIDQSGNGNDFTALGNAALDYDVYPLDEPLYEFYETAFEWESKLGHVIDWGVVGNGGALPWADMVGANNIDTLVGTPNLTKTWPGTGAGECFEQLGTGQEAVTSTNTDFLSPGTSNFCLYGVWKRGGEYDNGFSGIFDACNGNGNGLRIFEENGASDNELWFTGEAGGSSKNVRVSPGAVIGDFDVVYFLFSRTSSTTLEVWVAAEGGTLVLHESLAILAGDAFASFLAAARIGGNAGLGATNPGVLAKGFLYRVGQIGTADLFDDFRDTTRTGITEA